MARRRKLTSEDIPEIKDVERNVLETLIPETEEVEGKVIYEQDIRASSHSNGWTSDLLGAEVGSGNPPTDPPEKGEDPWHGSGDNKSPVAFRYILATSYLVFGSVMLYVGIAMIKDIRKDG